MAKFLDFYNKNYLTEATLDIDEDVDYVWKYGMGKMLELYNSNKSLFLKYSNDFENPLFEINSESLPSKVAKRAHSNLPITIKMGPFSSSAHFNPSKRELILTINSNAIEALGFEGLDNQEVIKEYPEIVKEFDPKILKTTIAHELAHWIDEALHKNVPSKEIDKTQKEIKKAVERNKRRDESWLDDSTRQEILNKFQVVSQPEIIANIQTFKELKRNYSQEEWDKLSLNDLKKIKGSFRQIFNKLKNMDRDTQQKFIKTFFGRLAKEGLLGKNMKINTSS